MLQIGSYDIPARFFLAPMAGVTDSIFRQICIQLGAGYVSSEMISADTTLHNSYKTRHRVLRTECTLPHVVQIVGSDPVKLAEAAAYNVKQGADIIDINMGCPAKKVCNKLAGSALLADEKLVQKILESVICATSVPVTLKIRTGPDRQRRNGVRIAKIAQKAGIQMLAVHGRTREDRFKGKAEYDTIAAIKEAIDIPVIANGDIRSPCDAVAVLKHTRADAVMVGRAAQGNPWIFRQLQTVFSAISEAQVKPESSMPDLSHDTVAAVLEDPLYSSSSSSSSEIATPAETHSVLLNHVKCLHNLYGPYRGLRIARKHISWYCKNQRGAAAFRDKINQITEVEDQLSLIDHFFEHRSSYIQTSAA